MSLGSWNAVIRPAAGEHDRDRDDGAAVALDERREAHFSFAASSFDSFAASSFGVDG